VAAPLGKSLEEAAIAVIELATENMGRRSWTSPSPSIDPSPLRSSPAAGQGG